MDRSGYFRRGEGGRPPSPQGSSPALRHRCATLTAALLKPRDRSRPVGRVAPWPRRRDAAGLDFQTHVARPCPACDRRESLGKQHTESNSHTTRRLSQHSGAQHPCKKRVDLKQRACVRIWRVGGGVLRGFLDTKRGLPQTGPASDLARPQSSSP